MAEIKFYSGENIPLELHKVKIVQKLDLVDVDRRAEAIKEAGNNTFLLKNKDIFLDMLTDSGVNAMSDNQLAAMMIADDSYAGSATFTMEFAENVFPIFSIMNITTRLKRSSAELLSEIGGVWSLVSGTYYVPEMEVKLEFLPNSRCLWTEEGVRERYSVSLVRDSEIYWLVIGDCEWVFRAVCSGEYLFLYSTCNLASEPQLILRR